MAAQGLHRWCLRAALVLLIAGFLPGIGMAKPARIVSMNVCADQLLLLLADREQIASLSFLATDISTSMMTEEAAGLPQNHGRSEEILPLEPDLILAGEYTARPTVHLLRKLGFEVIDLPVAHSLDDIRANIRTVAGAVGEPERGEAMIAAFNNKLPEPEESGYRPLAALYWANGFTSGVGTLASAVVEAAGFRNLGTEIGVRGIGQVPLETLISARPDILIVNEPVEAPAMATQKFRHPALQTAFLDQERLILPPNLWVCGTPDIADAVAALHETRAAIISSTLANAE
ncbi:ABC transporter substrate-binding protein [uncultured Sneathiella sp.]|uniref:ABC transporter substrate-binding protein n=1 Tax=uncultured Sneathiella sp. TaxID=879315 RepID=UPI0030EDDE4B